MLAFYKRFESHGTSLYSGDGCRNISALFFAVSISWFSLSLYMFSAVLVMASTFRLHRLLEVRSTSLMVVGIMLWILSGLITAFFFFRPDYAHPESDSFGLLSTLASLMGGGGMLLYATGLFFLSRHVRRGAQLELIEKAKDAEESK